MNQILEGWKMVLKDYRHWKMIIKYPYDAFDCAVFFGNLAEPPNSLDDYIKEVKRLDEEYEKPMKPQKPEFPKPRTIREDFLPEPMKKYRIKKETYGNTTKYYPQEKFLYCWYNIFAYEVYFDGGYNTLEEAQKRLCEYCREPVVEYLDFDPTRDCK